MATKRKLCSIPISSRGHGDHQRTRDLRAVPAAGCHRQRQDRGLSAPRRPLALPRAARRCFLVPEINLTPQLAQRIAGALPSRATVTLHSRLAAGERSRNWCAAATGEADLVLGTRLAVFAPLPRLALIVVDEEHDPSFKQQDGVRYHGRDVAVWRARQRGVPIVLGSATPSLETLVHAQRGRYRWLRLPLRAVAPARLPARLRPEPGAGRARGDQRAAPRGDRGAAAPRRAVARVHQPPRLRAVAAVRGVRLAGGMPALQRAPRRPPRRGRAALPSLRPRRAPAARHAPSAATSTCCRSATARSGSSVRWPGAFPSRASRASIATARDARARSPRFATAFTRARSTSSSARRCSPRATTSRGSRWSACWAPTMRSTAPISARPSGWPRCCSRCPGARGARELPGRSDRADRFPDPPAARAALAAHDYDRLRRGRCLRNGARRACRRSRISRWSSPKRRGATRSTRSSPRSSDAGRVVARDRRSRSRCSRRCRQAWRAAPASSADRCSRRRSSAARCSAFFRCWRDAIAALPGPARALGARRRSARVRVTERPRAAGATGYNSASASRAIGDASTARARPSRGALPGSRLRCRITVAARSRGRPMNDLRTQLEAWLAFGLAAVAPERAGATVVARTSRSSRSTATSRPTSRSSTRRR